MSHCRGTYWSNSVRVVRSNGRAPRVEPAESLQRIAARLLHPPPLAHDTYRDHDAGGTTAAAATSASPPPPPRSRPAAAAAAAPPPPPLSAWPRAYDRMGAFVRHCERMKRAHFDERVRWAWECF